jgi:chromate transporter
MARLWWRRRDPHLAPRDSLAGDAGESGGETEAPPTIGALFGGFFWVGILGFGGVLPLARRMIVDQRRWLPAAEFTDLLALCQFLPGANIVNVSISLGGRFRGPAGSLAALSGLLAAPIAVVIVLGMLYGRYSGYPVVAHGFAGLAAAASGLVLATALRIASPLRTRPLAIGIAIVAFVALGLLRLPLLPVLVVLVPVSVMLHRSRA